MFVRSINLAIDWFYRSRRKLAASALGLLACMLAMHVVVGANGMVVYQHKKAEYRTLDKQIDDLQRENDRCHLDRVRPRPHHGHDAKRRAHANFSAPTPPER